MTTDPPKSDSPPRPNKKRIDPLVGTILDDRFEIEEVLGSGGMSVVYKANQLRVNRHVAVKTLRMQLDSKPIYRERFQNEINLLCALSHPNIVTVYDCVIGPEEQPYVIMDYLRGRSLEVLIAQDGPMSVERCLRISVQVCGALDHAHRKGVIHRDLKPGNIVLMDDESDFVKVVDFGLAKLNDTNRKLTQSGELWGSPPYMSPEHCQSKPEDERSDLYSFGAVMYEMLTGKDPFHYATSVYELIQIHTNTAPPPLAEANPLVTVPAALEAVIFKAMEKKPEDRYQTASELRDALIEVSGGANGRHSGDLLALPTASKSRSQSTGEIVAPPNTSTPSEHFRRALDPMQGINVDELFSGTANSAVEPSQKHELSRQTHEPTPNDSKKAVITPLRIAAVAGFCVIAFLINALPNIIHPATVKSAPNLPAPQSQLPPNYQSQPEIKAKHQTPEGTNPASFESPAPVSATSSSQVSDQSTQTDHNTKTHPNATGGKKVPEKMITTHATLQAKAHAPNVMHHLRSTQAASTLNSPAHVSHPTSNAKSSNPWDALQGLRRGK